MKKESNRGRPRLVKGHDAVKMGFTFPHPMAVLIEKEAIAHYGGKKSPFIVALLCQHFNLDENYKTRKG